jgi:ADP-heptose:LPS heptosyltransferase
MPQAFKHILVIRFSAMGDVAMIVPVLRAFVNRYSHINITVLTRGRFAPLFRDIPNVSVFNARVDGDHKGLYGLFKLARELKALNVDGVADLHNVLRSKILKLFLFRKRFFRIDKGRKEKKALVSGRRFAPLKTTFERYTDVFATMGFPIDLFDPSFPDRVSLNDKTLTLIGPDSKKWIGIAPFAKHESKVYPLDLMEKVIKALSVSHKLILFGGGPKEISMLNALEKKFANVVSVAGKLTLKEELDLISNLDAMLSMDSGNGHLAAMMGVKVVTIWGATHPYAGFAPFNQPEDHGILSNKQLFPLIPTSIYGNKYPDAYKEVSRSIPPEIIIEKIRSVI